MIINKKLSSEILPNGITKSLTIAYNTGACQCFKDCDCYQNKGQIGDPFYLYNGKFTLEEAIAILERDNKNKALIDKYKNDAIQWRNALTNKEFNKVVDSYKKIHKQMNNLNHSEIYKNNDKVYLIHRFFLKYGSCIK